MEAFLLIAIMAFLGAKDWLRRKLLGGYESDKETRAGRKSH